MSLTSSLTVGVFALFVAFCTPAEAAEMRLHFAPNGNFGSDGSYLPRTAGFNLADVNSTRDLDALPTGVKGMAWVGRCSGVDDLFLTSVRAYLGHPKLWGFYL